MDDIILDLETRSALRLTMLPACAYAAHKSTSILCVGWHIIGESEFHTWAPGDTDDEAIDRLHWLIDDGAHVHAWNSSFDCAIWNSQPGWPQIRLEQQHDIAARAGMLGLPRGVEKAAAALGLGMVKDRLGANALKYLMAPRSWSPCGEPVFANDPARLLLVRAYCVQDLRLELRMHELLPELPASERQIWEHDARLNERGFQVDQEFLRVAGPFYIQAQREGDAAMRRITGGAVSSISAVKAFGTWLRAEGVDPRAAATDDESGDADDAGDDSEESVASTKGELSKSGIRGLLERPGLPAVVREALEVRQDYSRSSVAKLVALAGATGSDGRLRGSLVYHGTLTGRQTARIFQPQNLPRDSYRPDQWAEVIDDMRALDLAAFRDKHGSPMNALVRMLRGVIVAADGHELVVGDFSAVELRILAWLSDQTDLLEDLRHDEPIYEQMGARIYRLPIEEIVGEKRTFGKMVVLAAGFGLGWRSLIKQARDGYDLDVDEPLARDGINSYRGAFPMVPQLWRELEAAAFDAISAPGTAFAVAGNRAYLKVSRNRQWLGLQLPSGRWVRLHQPKIVMDDRNGAFEPQPTLSAMGLAPGSHQWVRSTFWGGVLTAYLVSATARDFLVEAALRVEARGWPTVLMVHDELVLEVPTGTVTAEDLAAEMNRLPEWADGCPITTKVFVSPRYYKD
jgi:DNA polymerase bacteriophage-type